jgi:hypothetical protein
MRKVSVKGQELTGVDAQQVTRQMCEDRDFALSVERHSRDPAEHAARSKPAISNEEAQKTFWPLAATNCPCQGYQTTYGVIVYGMPFPPKRLPRGMM